MSTREKSGEGFALANRGAEQQSTANIEMLNWVRRLKTLFFGITLHPELHYISIIAEVIRSVRKKEEIRGFLGVETNIRKLVNNSQIGCKKLCKSLLHIELSVFRLEIYERRFF
jgi:hypothetical protein